MIVPFEVLAQRFAKFEIELRAQLPAITTEMAGTALSYKITQIRRNRGLFSNAKYSDHPGVPAYLYKGKNGDYPRALNGAGRAYINRQIKEAQRYKPKSGTGGGAKFNRFSKVGFVNWKGLRAAQGLPVSKVDLTYTGRMFQNIGITDVRIIGNSCQATIGGTDQETKNKLKWNMARYGDFLNLGGLSIELAKKKAAQRINDLFKRIVIDGQ